MKNDFREFYDENYILHSAMSNTDEDDHLEHGRLLNAIHRYIDKYKARSGKWVYVYPDEVRKGQEGTSKYLERKRLNGMNTVYQEQQRKASAGMSSYNKRHAGEIAKEKIKARARKNRQLAAANANKQYYDQSDKARKARQLKAANANKGYYDKTGVAERKARQTAAANANKGYYDKTGVAERKARQTAAYNANRQYYDKTNTYALTQKHKAYKDSVSKAIKNQEANAKYYNKANPLPVKRRYKKYGTKKKNWWD